MLAQTNVRSRFLQSSSSSIEIDSNNALYQHGLASVACLFSSLRLVSMERQDALRLLVKGVYGLQVYAFEYWTEIVVSLASSAGGLDTTSALYALLCRFSEDLQAAFKFEDQEDYTGDSEREPSLGVLSEHPTIHNHIRRAIRARSMRSLEQHYKQEGILPPQSCFDPHITLTDWM